MKLSTQITDGGFTDPATVQRVIDLLAVLNALRAAFPPKVFHDL